MVSGLLGNNVGGGIAASVSPSTTSKATTTSTASTTTANANTSNATSTVVNQVLDAKPKPGDLAVGEVAQYTNSAGKTLYVVGKVGGGITKPVSTISALNGKIDNVIKSAEKAQITNLTAENKIEIIELKETLKDEGLSQSEINAAVKSETAANKAEVIQAKTDLKFPGYQVLSRNDDGLLTAQNFNPTQVTDPITGLLSNKPGLDIPTTFNTTTTSTTDPNTGVVSYNTSWNSLSYNGAGADVVKSNIVTNLNTVNEFKALYGLNNQPYTKSSGGSTDSTTGMSTAAIYAALSNGSITRTSEEIKDANGNVIGTNTDFDLSPDARSGLLSAGGKGFTRQTLNILTRDTEIGDKAFTVEKDGKTYITDSEGNFLKGNNKALVDTGQTTEDGLKIFTQTSNLDTMYNKASTYNVYVQNKDGSFTYMGTPAVGYTHIDSSGGFSLGSFVKNALISVAAASLGVPFLANNIIAPLLSGTSLAGSTVAANAIAGTLMGAFAGAATGQDALAGALTGGIGSTAGTILSTAADAVGGWTNLTSMLATDPAKVADMLKNIATATSAGAGIKLGVNAAGQIVDAATGAVFGGAGVNVTTDTALSSLTPGIDLTTGAGATAANNALTGGVTDQNLAGLINESPINTGATVGDVIDSYMPDLSNTVNATDLNPITAVSGGSPGISLSVDSNGNIIDNNTGLPFSSPGIHLGLDAAGNIIDATTGLPFTGAGVNVVNPITGTYVNPVDQIPFGGGIGGGTDTVTGGTNTGGTGTNLTGTIVDVVTNPYVIGGVIGGAVIPSVIDQLTPDTTDVASWTPFPQTNPNYGQTNMLGMPTWWQNLYQRGGYGAGNYLGYDVLKGLNIPTDVLSLLSPQAPTTTPTTLI